MRKQGNTPSRITWDRAPEKMTRKIIQVSHESLFRNRAFFDIIGREYYLRYVAFFIFRLPKGLLIYAPIKESENGTKN
jgi:hypothetical protein